MIDGGPLRTSRPAGRQVAYRNESVRQQPEEEYQPMEPAMQVEQPRPMQHYRQAEPVQAAPRSPRNFSWMKWLVVPLLLIVLAVAGWLLWPDQRSITSTIDTTKYQAVFLSNGQVYFGKLSIVNGEYMELTNVFYLERQLTASTDTEATPENTTEPTGDNNFQLLKYSDVLYGSEDAMVISKDDIIRYENLRPDGVVAKAIANRR